MLLLSYDNLLSLLWYCILFVFHIIMCLCSHNNNLWSANWKLCCHFLWWSMGNPDTPRAKGQWSMQMGTSRIRSLHGWQITPQIIGQLKSKTVQFQKKIKLTCWNPKIAIQCSVSMWCQNWSNNIFPTRRDPRKMHSEGDLLTAFATLSAVPLENGSTTETESAAGLDPTPGPSFVETSIPTHDNNIQLFSSEEILIRCDDMPVLTPVRHASASVTEYDEPPIMSPIVTSADLLNARKNNILAERNAASSSQVNQAESMVKRSRLHLSPGQPGDTATVTVPLVDRFQGDPRNLLGIILNHDDNDQYTICISSGILKGRFIRNQFDLCEKAILKESDVKKTRTIILCAAVGEEFASGGQGYVKCNCVGCKQCETNRCKCYKSKFKCSSCCHSGLSCKYK